MGIVQVNYMCGKRGMWVGGYQVSFVGYFLVDNLKYFCIVVVYKLCDGGFYGSDVVGFVFWEIVDKCFNSMIELYDLLNQGLCLVLYESNLLVY